MRYDFGALTDRRNTNSLKWDVDENVIPMWVADMDFKTAPEIIEAIQEKVCKGILGYTIVPDAWYNALSNWWERRHDFKIDKEWLIFCTGVVPAISSAVRKMTSVGENVLVQTPVYNIFFNSIVNNGRNIVENKLLYDGKQYSIDFIDLENKLSNPKTTMMILCNPHNPIGEIWNKDTLERMGELCYKHHVLVVSDEIHCDLTDTQHDYIPFASVSEICAKNSITCIAPTKAFNIAGLQTAAVVVPDEVIRHKMNKALNTDEVAEPNAIAMEATIAAFTKGEKWLKELRSYIEENRKFAEKFIETELPELYLVPAHATYLLWIDCSGITQDTTCLCKLLLSEVGLYVSKGEAYGETGRGFIRINMACPRERLEDGLTRLKKGIELFKKSLWE
ncbi:MalY/PatB family protein [Clostridium estertheticum]|uniref:Pyridoxal phosphate-dependent aminotransferase n=1 Tax=Clostridium estertheticum TaxID=238834 RepID=A0AA47EFP5_9CLOT|nr:MalY/PatB family protein [Clostridium estertheticum]MBU3156592.1 pyridoxal phosphate-dependent aminotransferase [Clostridium estertheticum]WAG59352.1 pyridoxal phosphate-dependent aminotransferase [Clostridium estertheticum]